MWLVFVSDLYKEYHDQEWGTPVYDDATLFEFFTETFQAGLSWITILNKRKIFVLLLTNSITKIATYNDDKILDLLQDAGIIRNKLKVYSAVTNAQTSLKSKKNLVPSPNIFGNSQMETTH
jgi:DNA-3-methyladenine glycosylase I